MEERSQPRLAPHISGIPSLCISINCLLCGLFVFRPKSGTTVNESEMDLCTKVITCPFNCNQYVPMLTGVVSPVKAECINKLFLEKSKTQFTAIPLEKTSCLPILPLFIASIFLLLFPVLLYKTFSYLFNFFSIICFRGSTKKLIISLLCFYLIVQHVSKITCTMIIISIFSGKVNFLMHPDACIDLDVCYLTLSTLHYDNNLMTRFSVL